MLLPRFHALSLLKKPAAGQRAKGLRKCKPATGGVTRRPVVHWQKIRYFLSAGQGVPWSITVTGPMPL
jgi:hypothetical protein